MLLKWFSRGLLLTLIFTLWTPLHAKKYKPKQIDSTLFAKWGTENSSTLRPTTLSVKGIYEIKTGKIRLIPPRYKYHYDYCKIELGYIYKLEVFNKFNYNPNRERRYICFNINKLSDSTTYIDFSVGAMIKADNLLKLFNKVKDITSPELNIRILCNTESIVLATKKLDKIHLLYPNKLYDATPFQPFVEGVARGKLCTERDLSEGPKIVIIENDFISPPIADGYIITQRVSPLSHIVMLANSQNAPLLFIQDSDSLKNYMGKAIELSLFGTAFSIKELTTPLKNNSSNVDPVTLKSDTSGESFLDLKHCSYDNRYQIGYKAANLAELMKVAESFKYHTPEGAAAISMKAYIDHCKRAKIKTLVSSLNSSDKNITLKIIRQRIRRTPLDSLLLDTISKHLENYPHFQSFRFRSSSNAEDIDGFSGAGLYRSASAQRDNREEIERAIKKVWASLWSERAYAERKRCSIDQQSAAMAVLIHRAFPNEQLNGVAITTNLYDSEEEYGYVLNMQKGDNSVVETDTSLKTELSISYFDNFSDFYNRTSAIDYIRYSSLSEGPLLSREEVWTITIVFKKLKRRFYHLWDSKKKFKDFAVDIEFKLDKTEENQVKLYIKQIRPF